jgi:isochorismate synthase EntC
MLRYENGRATLRPISGSVRRSDNPIEDHHLMMELLNSPKENSELDMLIDLGSQRPGAHLPARHRASTSTGLWKNTRT